MKHAFLILALVVLACSASMAATGPAAGWGWFNDVRVVVDGGYSANGYVYRMPGNSWEMGTATGIDGFNVTADVEMWMNMAFNANDIYFHIGKDLGANPKVSASVTGWLQSNNGQHLFVSKPDANPTLDDISKLEFQVDVLGRTSPPMPAVTAIPAKWYLTDTGGEREGTYSQGGNAGQLHGVSWLLDGGSTGFHSFTIRCEISPDRYQPDGHYEMDPILVASPEL